MIVTLVSNRAEPSKPIALNFHNFGLDVSSIKSNKFSSREIQHIMNSNSNACSILKHRRRQLVTKTNYFIEMDKIDHYGRESLYSGSCMKTIGKMVFYTGNDGKFRVSKLTEGDNALFDEVPSNGIFFKDGKLGFERIYSLHTNVMDDDQNYRYIQFRSFLLVSNNQFLPSNQTPTERIETVLS